MAIEWIEFVESSLFTRLVERYKLDTALRDLQLALVENPTAGDLDPGTGGLRKVRMPDPARSIGKRSGARVHFLWLPHRKRIYLMHVYTKAGSDTLTGAQKKALRHIVTQIKEIE